MPTPVLSRTLLSTSVSVPPPLEMPPPEKVAVLPLTVLSTSVTVPPGLRMPPPTTAVLPLTVLSMSFSVPRVVMPLAVPPVIVTFSTVADALAVTVTTRSPPLIVVRPAPAPIRLTSSSIVKPPA